MLLTVGRQHGSMDGQSMQDRSRRSGPRLGGSVGKRSLLVGVTARLPNSAQRRPSTLMPVPSVPHTGWEHSLCIQTERTS